MLVLFVLCLGFFMIMLRAVPAGWQLVEQAARMIDLLDAERHPLARLIRSFGRRQPRCRLLVSACSAI